MIIANKKIAPHPGEVPELILKENNLTQTKLALHLDIPQTKISEMVCKKRGLSAEMSMKLEKALGMKINSLDEFAEKTGSLPKWIPTKFGT